jgi:hypothetical protein
MKGRHDWDDVASDGFAAIFRAAEGPMSPVPGFLKEMNGSKDCQMKRVRSGHDERASNEGHGP